MAREAPARGDKLFAVIRVSRLLVVKRGSGKSVLPDECRYCLYVTRAKPELRHLGCGAKLGGVRDPVRNPLLVQLLARFLQVGAHFLNLLNQVGAAPFEGFALRIHSADLNGQVRRLSVELVSGGIIRSVVAQLLEAWNLLFIVGF